MTEKTRAELIDLLEGQYAELCETIVKLLDMGIQDCSTVVRGVHSGNALKKDIVTENGIQFSLDEALFQLSSWN